MSKVPTALRGAAMALAIGLLSMILSPILFAGQVDPVLESKLRNTPPMEKLQVLVYLEDQADLDQVEAALGAQAGPDGRIPVEVRYRTVLDALQRVAEETQPSLLDRLSAYEAQGGLEILDRFWIRNILVVKAVPEIIRQIAGTPGVGTVYNDAILQRDMPVGTPVQGDVNPESSEPGLRAINAHRLWALGYSGAGRLVMSIDTGVNGNNLSYNTRWRGAQPGVPASAAWFDPSGGTTFPVDCDGHGTHTMGTMCGLYTATGETLGVAPNAHWIASNSLCGGGSHTSRSIASFQWAANPDGDPGTINDVPDAISNSWYDPDVSSTQCTPTSGGYGPVIEAVEALGTAVVFSAGNGGPGASTVTPPKNRITSAVDIFAVGAVNANTPGYPVSSFSSRGPSTCTGPDSLRIKPEVSAPGENVRSASGTSGTTTMSGTSMASPHVAGAIALLREVAPFLTGTELKYILMNTAADLGTPGEDNDYGHGIIDLWAAYLALPLNMGYVKGQITSGGNPVSGVLVDFVENVQQLSGTTGATGLYQVSARIDTPNTTALYTLRAQKFGYITTLDTVTIVLDDTVTRNLTIQPAPGGTLQVHAHRADNSPVRAGVKVLFGTLVVVDDSTDAGTGMLSAPLPAGSYDVVVDPPSPYWTRTFTGVGVTAGQTTMVDALLRSVFEIAPSAVRDTLVVGQVSSKTMTITNTTADPVQFRVSDDEALTRAARISKPKPLTQRTFPVVELPKDAVDPAPGSAPAEGRGGPDPFGYEWVDSDEPDGPVFNWVDITGVGTPIPSTAWQGSDDDGRITIPLPLAFPFYGTDYNSIKLVTNGWMSFDVASTLTTYSNGQIPSTGTGAPNNAIYPWWDDLDLDPTLGGTVHYYHDAGNQRFIIQYTNVPHFGTTTPGRYTFQVMMYQNGSILVQYLDMQQTLNSATIGIENQDGTMGLQVVYNAAYMHNNLAILFHLPDAPWISENPLGGTIPGGSAQDITVSFNAAGLTVGTTYNANLFVEASHPDVAGPYVIPASLSIELADSAVLILESSTVTFAATQINTTVRDTLTAKNGGLQTLTISSISSTNGDMAVAPAGATLSPGDSVHVVISYTPTQVGTDTGRVIFLSNSQGSPRLDVMLEGICIGAPSVSLNPATLSATLQPGQNVTHTFTITNATPPPTVPLLVGLAEGAGWLSVDPGSDTLAGGASGTINVTFDAMGMPLGTVTADITITTNDPASPSVAFPCTLNVVGGPVIAVHPDSLYQSLNSGNTAVDTLVIRNAGVSTLNWTITDIPAAPAAAPAAINDGGQASVGKGEPDVYTGPPVTEGRGGPDSAGYRWIDSDEPDGPVFNWVDITGVGTPIPSTSWQGSDDDGRITLPLPFAFAYYGTEYTSIKLVTNGWMSFDVASTLASFSNGQIPSTGTTAPNNAVYPWWDDLDLDPTLGGTVHYYHDAPNQRWIVQYTNVPHYGTTTPGRYTFQVMLYQNGSILVQYLDMQQTLNSATIGIENASGTVGLQVVYNAAYMHNNLAILFAKDVSWLSENPVSGAVAPGDSALVEVTFDATGLVGNVYRGRLEIASNDLQHTPTYVPVTLHVAGVPGISVPTSSLPFGTVFVGDTAQARLVIRNVGSDLLQLTGFSVLGGGGTFSMNLSPASLAIGDSLVRPVFFSPDAAASYAGQCMILSNDPDPADDTVMVALSGIGSVAPVGSVFPASITHTMQQGTVDSSRHFAIRNTGGSPLTWDIAEVPPAEAVDLVMRSSVPMPNAPSPNADLASSSLRYPEGLLALGDTLFSFNVENVTPGPAVLQLGVEYAMGYYWVTGGLQGAGSKYLYKFNPNGTLAAAYPQGTSTTFGWRDLCFDGRYLYTSDENEFAKIDPLTGAKVGTRPKPVGQTVLRGLAFDPATRTFWTKNFGGALVHFDSTGAILGSYTNALAVYGLAWDRWSPGGPFLWMWSQDGPVGGQKLTATRMNPLTGQPTGVSFLGRNYAALPDTDIAGGAAISDEIDLTRPVFLGLHQSSPDRVVGYDLGVTLGLPWVNASVTAGSTAPGDSSVVKAVFNSTGISGGTHNGRFRITTNDPAHAVLYVDLTLDVIVSVDETERGIPQAYTLAQNFPNPFNPATSIRFGLPEEASFTLRVYDLLGREVRSLASGTREPGNFKVEWDGTNALGQPVSSGIYFYRLEARGASGTVFTALKKMILMK
ncbi:MAG: S8 family serine peptidase [Bacteroidota bacterium]